MSFTSWHDFLYMGGHYLYVWSAYGIGVFGLFVALVRPLHARRRFFRQQSQRLRRQSTQVEGADASRTS